MSKANLSQQFALLEEAAARGDRCPQSRPHGPIVSGVITALARAGKIRSEVYVHNWRVVEILVGPHAGKRTAPEPTRHGTGKPYKVTDASGTRINGRLQNYKTDGPNHPGPSAPKDYSRGA